MCPSTSQILQYLSSVLSTYIIGPSLVKDEASVVITGEIKKPKMFRVVDHSDMTVLLVIPEGITNDTKKENFFKLSYEGIMRETPDITTPTYTSSTPEPSADREATVYVEVLHESFAEAEFIEVVVNMTREYCNNKTIHYNLTGPENVQLTGVNGCPGTWSNSKKCIKITMTVKVWENPYALNSTSIEDMWNMYADDMLKAIGLKVSAVPDNQIIFNIWLPISLAVLAIFTLLMVALWHFDVFNTSLKKDAPLSVDHRASNVSKQTWVSNSSYQEVPPMTDLPYDDIYTKPRENSEITTSPNTLSVSHERPPSSDQFSAAYHFQRQGYDNPSFDVSSERHHSNKADYHDDPSSDDDSSATRSTDTKSPEDHLHTAPQQVMNEDNKRESAV
jgi:hypothetical protein